jgi:hypothetical protein
MDNLNLNEVIVVVLMVGVAGKIIWSWLSTGRTEKGVFITQDKCESRRQSCDWRVSVMGKDLSETSQEIKSYISKTDVKLDGIEKRLDKGDARFSELQKELVEIKETMSGIKGFIETKVHKILVKE